MKYIVTHRDREVELELSLRDDGRYDVTFGDGRVMVADFHLVGGDSLASMILDNDAYEVSVVPLEDRSRVTLRGQDVHLNVESEQERNARLVEGGSKADGPVTIKSVMPGRVVRVLAEEGQELEQGTSILILEAMKMENEIKSPIHGTLQKVHVEGGQTVGNGEALAVILPAT